MHAYERHAPEMYAYEMHVGGPFDPENPPKSVALSDAACLRIRIQTLNCSSPFVVKLKCFTCCDSGFQMPDLKTFSFPGGEIPSCPYKVPDLDGRERSAVDRSYASTRLTPSYLSSIDILVAQTINMLIRDLL